MMKRDVATLSGIELDYAVAQITGMLRMVCGTMEEQLGGYSPSTKWQHGGPIIEREKIEILVAGDGTWTAITNKLQSESSSTKPLTAAMRAFVHGKVGDAVDL